MSGKTHELEWKDFCTAVKKYSIQGLVEYGKLPSGTRAAIEARISPLLLKRTPHDVERRFNKVGLLRFEEKFLFIPMPKAGSGANFDWAFFVPRFMMEGSEPTCAFCLLLWKGDPTAGGGKGRIYSFRFEPTQMGSHEYAHIQLTRDVRDPNLETDLPSWMCTSYPAFPIASSPLRMFLTVLVAIHGFSKSSPAEYANEVIERAIRDANPIKAAIRGAMREMLGAV